MSPGASHTCVIIKKTMVEVIAVGCCVAGIYTITGMKQQLTSFITFAL